MAGRAAESELTAEGVRDDLRRERRQAAAPGGGAGYSAFEAATRRRASSTTAHRRPGRKRAAAQGPRSVRNGARSSRARIGVAGRRPGPGEVLPRWVHPSAAN